MTTVSDSVLTKLSLFHLPPFLKNTFGEIEPHDNLKILKHIFKVFFFFLPFKVPGSQAPGIKVSLGDHYFFV